MIQFLVPQVIPNVGAYNAGDHVELLPELEKQLIASGKAVQAGELDDKRVVEPVGGFRPHSHAD